MVPVIAPRYPGEDHCRTHPPSRHAASQPSIIVASRLGAHSAVSDPVVRYASQKPHVCGQLPGSHATCVRRVVRDGAVGERLGEQPGVLGRAVQGQ
jgi:hypothetical protein